MVLVAASLAAMGVVYFWDELPFDFFVILYVNGICGGRCLDD